jgi:hypothetical protein
MAKKINKNKVIKKQKKNEKKSKQKQKQKQTVNVKVNIDQSKRTAPRATPQPRQAIHSGNANTPLHTVIQTAQPYPFNMYQPFIPHTQDNSFKDNYEAYGNKLEYLKEELDNQRHLLTNMPHNPNPKQLYKLLMNEHHNQMNNPSDDATEEFKSNSDATENEFADNHAETKTDFVEEAKDKGDVPVKLGRGRPRLTEDQATARQNDKEAEKMRKVDLRAYKKAQREKEKQELINARNEAKELKKQQLAENLKKNKSKIEAEEYLKSITPQKNTTPKNKTPKRRKKKSVLLKIIDDGELPPDQISFL